ncbi:MAG TPA: hypothetical protein VFY52_05375 [Thermoleophilaceae bacterium]|nr:hypothetical protein [Thermoleophilaceae bacterium]
MSRIASRRPSASLVIACLALFVALGGVGYAAATIGSAAIVDNSIRSKDVHNNDLRGKDVRANTLKGADVDESSLGKVPSAANADSAATAAHATNADSATNASQAANADTVGGVGPDALTIGRSALGSCEPGAAFSNCTSVVLSMPRPGRVLLNAGGQWHSDNAAGTSVRGLCRINLDGNPLTGVTEEGSLSQQTDGNQEQALAGVTAVTGVLPAGDHTFTVACSDDVGDMDFTDVRLSAVLLGSS